MRNKFARLYHFKKALLILSATAVTLSFQNCGQFQPQHIVKESSQSSTGTPIQQSSEGATLYAKNCVACHGVLENSVKKGRTLAQINAAIASVPQMAGLSVLTDAQRAAIASALTPPTNAPMACTNPVAKPKAEALRRLTAAELQNSLSDLLYTPITFATKLPAETYNRFPTEAASMPVSDLFISTMMGNVEAAVTRGFAMSAARLVACTPVNATDTCTQNSLRTFAERAFRRPLRTGELAAITKVVTDSIAAGDNLSNSIRIGFQAILMAPDYLYLANVKPDPENANAISMLNDYEIAAQLSFFLWSTIPDVTLTQAAAQSQLRTPAGLKTQLLRMLADPRAKSMHETFLRLWTRLDELDGSSPDPLIFPNFSPAVKSDMKTETALLLQDIWANDLPIKTLIGADFTYLNQNLAAYYGVSGVTGTNFRKVPLAQETQRRGFLTHGSFLTMTSAPNRTSIVRRGEFIMKNVLCEPISPPPPGIPALPENNVTGSQRTTIESLTASPNCMGCHGGMNPLGFGLEHFDGIGRWRINDNGYSINPSGKLPTGESFNDAAGELALLNSNYKVTACLAKQTLVYATGRPSSSFDYCQMETLGVAGTAPNQKFSDFLWTLISSDEFLKIRGGTP